MTDGRSGDASVSLRQTETHDGIRLALASFGLLALELAVIRWLSSQVRVFAYLNNVVLISAFLGMGLGVALSERRPFLRSWILPGLLIFVAFVSFSGGWLSRLSFPDVSLHLWGAEQSAAVGTAVISLAAVLMLLTMVVGCFLLQGVAVGHFFRRLPTLRAYSFDLLGSLLGVLAYTAVTALGTPPPIWFLVGILPFLAIGPAVLSGAAAIGIVALTALSIGDALYSPYNRIELFQLPDGDVQIGVNQDFHQYLHDLSDARVQGETDPEAKMQRSGVRAVYDLPYLLPTKQSRALIVGAGAGNDAQAGLRNGFDSIYAVDIDARILRIGRELHPERPYDDPRVVRVVDDARAFLQRYDGPPFDVVSYGFLDSHAMFSSMSSLRLENYVYSEEGLRAAWEHLAQDGVMSVAFSVAAGPWIQDRIYWTLAKATGKEPRIVAHNLYQGSTFLVSKSPELDLTSAVFQMGRPSVGREEVRTTSDNWPFLYIRPGTFPWAYVVILSSLLAGAVLSIRRVFGSAVTGGGFDAPLFLFGAAFLLLETRGITSLSLLFGSTWLVNAAVFGGILLTALAANLFVNWRRPERDGPWFITLFAALALMWFITPSHLAGLPMVGRGLAAGLLTGLPVGFAGVIVSIRLARSSNPTASLGSNLLGAVLGGCLEYLSMVIGLHGLLVMAAALYGLGLLFTQRLGRTALDGSPVRAT